tara:strand:- start:1813 stop:5241 length:3429 start_codon:yes stop_codon:yes gene_type:complete
MSYTRTFYFNYKSITDLPYRLEFYDQGQFASNYADEEGELGANTTQIKFGSDGGNMYSPIKASTLTIDFVVNSSETISYIEQLKTNRTERDVYVYLYAEQVNGTANPTTRPIFAGYLLMDLSDDPDVSIPYTIKLRAVDGIASLKYFDFIHPTSTQNATGIYEKSKTWIPDSDATFGVLESRNTIVQWLRRILFYSGFSTTAKGAATGDARIITAANWYNGLMPNTTDDPLFNTQMKAEAFYKPDGEEGEKKFKSMTAYDALKSICEAWGMRCFVWRNSFYFIQIDLYETNESGTQQTPDNIQNYGYVIDYTSTAGHSFVSQKLDQTVGRYQIIVDNTLQVTQNKKLAGGQYGLLPSLKKVLVDFDVVANINYFTEFPNIAAQSDISGTPSGYEFFRTYKSMGIFDCDGVNDQSFYHEVWLQFDNPTTAQINMEMMWTIEMKLVSQGSFQKEYHWNHSSQTKEWVTIGTGTSGGEPHFGYGIVQLQPGVSSHNICAATYSDNHGSYITLDAASFPAGQYELRYATYVYNDTVNFPGGPYPWESYMWGHGACNSYASADVSPYDLGVTYTNSNLQFGTGASVLSPITNGQIGAQTITTQLSQSSSDTDEQEVKNVIIGDTQSSNDAGAIFVNDGSSYVHTSFGGQWGKATTSGALSFSELLGTQILARQVKPVRKFSGNIIMSIDPYLNDGSATRIQYPTPYTRYRFPSHTASGTVAGSYIMHSTTFETDKDSWKVELYEFETFTIPGSTTTTTGTQGSNSGTVGNGPGQTGGGTTPEGSSSQKLSAPTSTFIGQYNTLYKQTFTPLTFITTNQSANSSGEITVTSLAIIPIQQALLKTGDTIQLRSSYSSNAYNSISTYAARSLNSGFCDFVVSADQSATDETISVVSKTFYGDINIGDMIVVSQPDLVKQYQNKTKGTVAGFTVDDDGLAKGGVEITGFLDSDTMTGATANNLPTAESVKAYVDANSGGTSNYKCMKCSTTVTTSSTDGDSNAVTIPFDTQVAASGSSTITFYGASGVPGLSSTAYTFSMPVGTYKINWNVGSNTNIVNNRILSGVKLMRGEDTGEGAALYSDVDTTYGYIYDRGNSTVRKGSVSGSVIFKQTVATGSQVFKLVIWKEAASNASMNSITLLNATNITVEEL